MINSQESATASTTISVPALASYAVKYNANGGSGTTLAQTKYYGQALALRSNDFTRTNHVFKNWNTKSDGSGTSYAAGASYTGNAALTLYAQWYAPYTVSYDANGGSGAPASQTKVHGSALALSSTKPTRTGYVFWHWNTGSGNGGTTYAPGASYTANAALKLYAIWNPIVYYDANGGTGAPSSQTKTYGTALTLSSTKPTRTGYTFSKWNTAKAGTGTNYNAGASYTSNSTTTLYAQWTANTYTVSFNANGGTGAPSSQTKTYDKALTLSSTKPTRIGHTFLGWSTSSTATAATWGAGGTFSTNITANTTLYAVWKSNYAAPKITSLTAVRCNSAGTPDDEGGYAKVTAAWSTMQSIDQNKTANYGTVTGKTRASNSSSDVDFTFSSGAGGTGVYSGTAVAVVPNMSTEKSYSVTVSVTDAQGGKTTVRGTLLTSAKFILDFMNGGEGIGIGAAAPSSGLVIGKDTTHTAALTQEGGTISIKAATLDRDGTDPQSSETIWEDNRSLTLMDKDGEVVGRLRIGRSTGGVDYAQLLVWNEDGSGNPVYNTFAISVGKDGTRYYSMSDPDAFVSALGLDRSATVTTISQVITAASGITINSVSYTERAGIAHLNISAKGFAASTGTQAVGTVASGKRPAFIRYESITSAYAAYCSLTSAGALAVYWVTAPSPSTSYTMSLVYPLA